VVYSQRTAKFLHNIPVRNSTTSTRMVTFLLVPDLIATLTSTSCVPQAALVLAMPLLSGQQDRSLGQLPTYGAIFRGGLAYTASVLGALIAPVLLGIARVLVLGGLCTTAARVSVQHPPACGCLYLSGRAHLACI
jgi:hypothetical protein